MRCGVEAHLVGSRVYGRRRVGFGADAAADREGDEQLARHGADGVGERAPRLERRRNVEDHELVDPLRVVAARKFGGIARRAQAVEVHALDHLSVANVETGDDALREHGYPRGHRGS